MPGDRFLYRLSGYEEEANALIAGLDGHLVAGIEDNEGTVARHVTDVQLLTIDLLFDTDANWFRGIAKGAGTRKNIGERITIGVDWQPLLLIRRRTETSR